MIKGVAERPHPQWACVGAAGAPAAVVEDAEDRHPAPSGDQQDHRVDEAGNESD